MSKGETKRGRGENEVTIIHNGVKRVIDIDAELAIDPQNIQESYLNQAGAFAWYAVVNAAALKRVDFAKNQLEMVRADVDVARATAAARLKVEMTEKETDKKGNVKTKQPSQSAIDAILDSQEEVVKAREVVVKAQEAYTQARYEQEVVRAVKDSFVHRRDMLMQLGADIRQEKKDSAH